MTARRLPLLSLPLFLCGLSPRAEADEERAAAVEWFKARAHAITTREAGDDDSDLEALGAMVGDARIVGLGEATHGSGDFFRLKHRIVRHLVEERGFTHFCIEANFSECRAVDAYILGGEGDARSALRGLGAWTWATEEVAAMVEWMRAHNARPETTRKLRFVGIDMTRARGAAADLLRFVEEVDFEFAEDEWSLAEDVRACLQEIARGGRLDRDEEAVANRTELLALLAERFEEYGLEYSEESSAEDTAFARHGLRVVQQALSGFAERDRYMAENTSWLLEQAGPQGKVITWAHNGHIARNGLRMLEGSQGHHLSQRHGEDYFALGFSFLQGGFQCMSSGGLEGFEVGPHGADSLDAVLAECEQPLAFFDLRGAEAGSPVARWLARPQRMRTVGGSYAPEMEERGQGATNSAPAAAFDVLVFVRETTRATPLG